MNAQPKLLDQVRDRLRQKHYSLRTEESDTHGLNKGGRGVKSPLDRVAQRVAEYCAGFWLPLSLVS